MSSARSLFSLGVGLIALGISVWLVISFDRQRAAPVDGTDIELRIRSAPPRVAAPPIEVRVSVADRSREISLEMTGPGRLVAFPGGSTLLRLKSLPRSTASLTTRGIRVAGREWSAGAVELVPDSSPSVWVGDSLYRGRVRLHRQGDRLTAVNVLPVEDYLASVIDSEMPASFPLEARKAQAIVARTFALYQRESAAAAALAELGSSVKSQKYHGYQYRDGGRLLAGESVGSRQAVDQTRGLVCTYQGHPICTYYCAVCGGRTVIGREIFDDAAPVLRSVPCEFCRESDKYRWTVTLSKADVFTAVGKFLAARERDPGRVRSIRLSAAARPGEIPDFEVRGDRRVAASGYDLRLALLSKSVLSPRFVLQDKGANLIFTGQGHGHGAGLCQWGARGQAIAGRTARQIVEYYYPGAEVRPLTASSAATASR